MLQQWSRPRGRVLVPDERDQAKEKEKEEKVSMIAKEDNSEEKDEERR